MEAIGFLALIASLIFVGLQIRQDHTIAKAQNAADFDDGKLPPPEGKLYVL